MGANQGRSCQTFSVETGMIKRPIFYIEPNLLPDQNECRLEAFLHKKLTPEEMEDIWLHLDPKNKGSILRDDVEDLVVEVLHEIPILTQLQLQRAVDTIDVLVEQAAAKRENYASEKKASAKLEYKREMLTPLHEMFRRIDSQVEKDHEPLVDEIFRFLSKDHVCIMKEAFVSHFQAALLTCLEKCDFEKGAPSSKFFPFGTLPSSG